MTHAVSHAQRPYLEDPDARERFQIRHEIVREVERVVNETNQVVERIRKNLFETSPRSRL